MGWISRCWHGEEDLWKVIWVFGILFVFLGQVIALVFLLSFDIDLDNLSGHAANVLLCAKIAYAIWLIKSLWSCALNTHFRLLGCLLRLAMILTVLAYGGICYLANEVLPLQKAADTGIHFSRALTRYIQKHYFQE